MTMTFDLIFSLQCQLQIEVRVTGYLPEITSAREQRWSETTARLPGQLTQP